MQNQIQEVRYEAWDSAFPTSSQVMKVSRAHGSRLSSEDLDDS